MSAGDGKDQSKCGGFKSSAEKLKPFKLYPFNSGGEQEKNPTQSDYTLESQFTKENSSKHNAKKKTVQKRELV